MATSSIFKNLSTPISKKAILLIVNDIASDLYKDPVLEIRQLIADGKIEEAQAKKKQLIAFTPSAVFSTRRTKEFIEMYSGYIHLDFDKLTPNQMEKGFEAISKIPFTAFCFVSPSGKGLKVFVEVNTGMEHHDAAYLEVQKFYEDAIDLKVDPACKDITRLCFVSYDPNLFKNLKHEKFIVKNIPAEIIQEQAPINNSVEKEKVELISETNFSAEIIFKQQIQFTNQKLNYENGNRNNYIYLLASNCNRVGLQKSDVEILCSQYFDLPKTEILEAINSTYKHHSKEHDTIKLKPFKGNDDEIKEEEQMPTLPSEIYESIPDFFKQIINVANSNEERDILLLSSLVTMSVAIPKVTGMYRGNLVNANLFCFITAKASAGKGVIIHCRKLIEPIHNDLREQAKILKARYESEMMIYNMNKGNDNSLEKPQKPPQKMLFIPANNSSTGFFELLNDSDSRGILFETEGDTLSNAFKSDYGNYSDGFRKAFHWKKRRN